MKLAAIVLSTLMLTLGPVGAQEKTFRMGSRPTSHGLTQTVRHTSTGPVIHFEQPASYGPSQPQPLIFGLTAVDLTPDGRNLMSYAAIMPQQAFIGAHPYGQPAAGGNTPAFGFNRYGPMMPFYGGGVGVVLGDGAPKLWGW